MPCADFEDLLSAYADLSEAEKRRVDAHTASCRDCGEFRLALAALDDAFTAHFAAANVAPELAACVRLRISTPSFWPEALDFCAWAALTGVVCMLVPTITQWAVAVLK